MKLFKVFVLFSVLLTGLYASSFTKYLRAYGNKWKYTMKGSSIDYATLKIVCKNGRKGILFWNVEPNMFIFSVKDMSGRTVTGRYVDGGGGGADHSKNHGQEKALREFCR